jgi:putative transposase
MVCEVIGIQALQQALRQARPATGLVHHSYQVKQYCSNQYVSELKKHKVEISMTEENRCYENAVAERVNGILKDEFNLDQCFFNTENAKVATKSAISLYNNKRLHLPLGYKTTNRAVEIAA